MRVVVEELVSCVTWASDSIPRRAQQITRPPSILVHRLIAIRLEVLNVMTARSISIVERIDQACAFELHLPNPVHDIRWLDPRSFIDCGSNVRQVRKLTPQATAMRNACRPRDDHRIPRTAQVRGIGLRTLKRCAEHPGPR